jgi:hypothetical protein
MEGEPLSTFYTQLVLWPKVMQYAQYVLLALGGALLLVPVVYQVRSQVGGRGRAGGTGRDARDARDARLCRAASRISRTLCSSSLS